MGDIYPRTVEILEEGRFSVLATLVRLSGSAPRGVGTECLILEDGSFEGTIGGGLLEARVLKEAKSVFEVRRPLRLHFVLRGKDVAETEMLCGGDAEIFLEPLFPGNAGVLAVIKRAIAIKRNGGSGVLIVLLSERQGEETGVPRMLLEPDGRRTGGGGILEELVDQCKERLQEFLRNRKPGIGVFKDREDREVEIFLEPVVYEPTLYVFGGGHVSQQLVPLAARVGFRVVVIDDRPEFADPGLFPDAVEIRCLPFEGVVEGLDTGKEAYMVIVTRGHLHDKTVLQQCLKTAATYIGMIGSRRKVNLIFNALLEQGFCDEDIRRVHSPIGLAIGAETPEEIAVSIVAELIRVRAGMDGDIHG